MTSRIAVVDDFSAFNGRKSPSPTRKSTKSSANRSSAHKSSVSKSSASKRGTSKQSLIGGTALAAVVLSCSWVVYSNIFAVSAYPSVAFEERFNGVGFDSRFDAVYSAPGSSFAPRFVAAVSQRSDGAATYRVASAEAATPAQDDISDADSALRANTVALLDVTHSLGAQPSSFVSTSRNFDQSFAALTPQDAAPKPQDAAPVRVASASLNIPLPTRRPQGVPSDGPSVREVAQAGRATKLATAAPPKPPSIFERLFGKPNEQPDMTGPELAYAGPDGGIDLKNLNASGQPMFDRYTAVYDISARTVYLPDGTKLEAHSGLGDMLDNPKYANVRMRGVTPPHVYDLKPRESLFHGVAALRLVPVGGEESIFGRSGLLAHTYMLGPNGDSNGCVSFKDYNTFLQAYRDQKIKRLAVVASLNT